jgi:hypothetical protein
MQNTNQPPVSNLRTTAMQSQLADRNKLAQFKEEIANMMKNKLSVDMWLFLLVGVCPISSNVVVMITVQPRNTLANILLN